MKNILVTVFLCLTICNLKASVTDSVNNVQTDSFIELKPLCHVDNVQNDSWLDRFVIVPGQGLFAKTADGQVSALDKEKCNGATDFLFLDNLWYDQIVPASESMWVRSGCDVYHITPDETCLVAQFDTPAFRLFANDSVCRVLTYNQDCRLFNLKVDGTCVLDLISDTPISTVISGQNVMLVASQKTIYWVENGEAKEFISFPEEVIDFNLVPNAIIVALENAVIKVDYGGNAEIIANEHFGKILHDNGRTYFIRKNGNISYTDKLL